MANVLKLDKILESMDSFKINSEVALLENEGIDALTVAQTRKAIHESFAFIKSELIAGGVLKEAQDLLSQAWTQAILEDMHIPSMDEVQQFGNHVAGGAQYAGHAIAADAGLLSGAAQGGNLNMIQPQGIAQGIANAAKQGYDQGYHTGAPSPIVDYKVGEVVGEHPIAAPVAATAGLIGAAALTNKAVKTVAGKVRRAGPKA